MEQRNNRIKIPSKTWWEMRRLKYNILTGSLGLLIVLFLNLYIKKDSTFDPVFFFTSIGVAVIYALVCNLFYTALWMLDHLSFGNELINFKSPKRTAILYIFVFLSLLVPFGILLFVQNTL
jgi:hypothetical protein